MNSIIDLSSINEIANELLPSGQSFNVTLADPSQNRVSVTYRISRIDPPINQVHFTTIYLDECDLWHEEIDGQHYVVNRPLLTSEVKRIWVENEETAMELIFEISQCALTEEEYDPAENINPNSKPNIRPLVLSGAFLMTSIGFHYIMRSISIFFGGVG